MCIRMKGLAIQTVHTWVMHTHGHRHVHMQVDTGVHTHAHTHTHTHTTHTHTHTHTPKQHTTHTHITTHTQTHTHTHTHTHTPETWQHPGLTLPHTADYSTLHISMLRLTTSECPSSSQSALHTCSSGTLQHGSPRCVGAG